MAHMKQPFQAVHAMKGIHGLYPTEDLWHAEQQVGKLQMCVCCRQLCSVKPAEQTAAKITSAFPEPFQRV